MSKSNQFQEKMQKFSGVIQSNKYISAITNGLMSLLPVTMVGSIGSLINALPIDVYQDFLTNTGLKSVTAISNDVTNNLLALYAVYMIAVKFVKSHDLEGTSAGMLSLMAFLIVTPYTLSESGSMSALPTSWFGAQGLFTAFIVALVVGKIYVLFNTKGWVIKMPDGVPPTVSKSFSSLIPSFVVLFLMLAVRFLFGLTEYESIHQFIFNFISTPLTALGGSFPAMFVAVLLVSVFWLFGIHGTLIIYTVFAAIWTPLQMENLAAFNAGSTIPYIVSMSLFSTAVSMGAGQTLGLSIAMFRAKSKRYKTLGKLSLIPNICGINEPVIFGTPLVLNFRLAIPFIVTPLLTLTGAYVLMNIGILPMLTGVSAPLGTPIIIGGLIKGGWQWAVWEAIAVVISYVIYNQFFKGLDKEAYEEEQKQVVAEAA